MRRHDTLKLPLRINSISIECDHSRENQKQGVGHKQIMS